MGDTKFTKGGWRLSGPDEFGDYTIQGPDESIAVAAVVNGLMRELSGPTGEQEANAHLIVAAPCMFDALERVEAVMSYIPPRTETKEYLATLEHVRNVLAKARGESND